MKNRKIVVVAFTLVAVLLLGVGYAAMSDDLYVKGTVSTNTAKIEEDFKSHVFFTSYEILLDDTKDDYGQKATVAIADSDNGEISDEIVITANNFTQENQKVQILATIKNTSTEYNASVSAREAASYFIQNEEGHSPIFSVQWEWYENDAPTGDSGAKTIESNGGLGTILVTITLTASPNDGDHGGSISITLDAVAVTDLD